MKKVGLKGQVCNKGIWDETIPGISFDRQGSSNYSKIFEKMLLDYPRGEKGEKQWAEILFNIKSKSKNKKYDCIIGLSGGTDSCYLLHLIKKQGLNPLAVYLDNGWSSNISQSNIEKITTKLNVDLFTYVINYNEVKEVLKSYLRAGLPWADCPTDIAIKAILYKIANKNKIKHILVGHDFRSEGFQPDEWTYSDAKQLKYLVNKFSGKRLKSFPTISIWQFIYFSYLKGIKLVRPFFYLPYTKKEAKLFLIKEYDWQDYGGHHYENVFTKFILVYWLYEKFGIDKRKITFSGQILSGEINRDEAIKELEKDPFDANKILEDKMYILKKLDIEPYEFEKIFKSPNKNFYDYPSYYPLFKKFKKVIFYLMKYLLPNKPLMFYQMEERMKNE